MKLYIIAADAIADEMIRHWEMQLDCGTPIRTISRGWEVKVVEGSHGDIIRATPRLNCKQLLP